MSFINAIADFFEALFSPVVNLLGWVLRYFHYDFGLEWWLSIAALTILVRTLMFPLTVRQVKSMRAMQELRPELEKIRRQFSNNRRRQQEEMMKLYQERNINPLGGCLPILLQMPIFIGIFYVIRRFGGYGDTAGTEPSFQQGGILWFQNLSEMDPYLILPVLSAATMFAASWITARNLEPQQRYIILLLPVVITVFLWNFPAGLFVYWITSNIVTFVQNYVIYNSSQFSFSNPLSSKKQSEKESPRSEDAPVSVSSPSTSKSGNRRKNAKRKRRKKK
ncbi:Membrane protein insertase, YidC/Oxa1 family [Rubrobacter radiotolerans]|uniref:Membrane protein insertase YidC n=1 Tax=Rubrobacter radiotolerans TaxID=42256 RepID=A0A023X6X8_RUBRA|nr:membrane protein insertase YidC [Rubrobacter radiotolerans]AHY48053.1 Membrane protein insertase, YidC/Oxa1 family [Rubrobacter radiotolerans]MDX5892692.1 membrane protein insertase YidC [Rubrobacter radiotolerans]SMC08133.1 YidC/Oxa1 family membrane protein insertase [Rubrobacter radiotolerans DSM 5868]